MPEEGDKAGKIDCYECQVCDKKFKNALEKQGPGSSAGRGSAICHVATGNFFNNTVFLKNIVDYYFQNFQPILKLIKKCID